MPEADLPTDIAVYTHAAAPTELSLWVGYRGTQPPQVSLELDGAPLDPADFVAARPMSAARRHAAANERRIFTAVYRIGGLSPNTPYQIRAVADGLRSPLLHTRTLPSEVANGESFRILLVSCYHRAEDPKTLLRALSGALAGAVRPNLVLLLGDQVYLDLPTERDFPDDEAALEKIFENEYATNWLGVSGLRHVLGLGPLACAPDDHEYWNNFPNAASIVSNTWTEGGRERWKRAARAQFDAFQRTARAGGGTTRIDADPLSIFILDTRSDRSADRSRCTLPADIQKLESWCAELKAKRQFGVLVTGQSLLAEATGTFEGRIADWELPNYGDYGRIVRAVVGAADATPGFLLVTGDVHYGRVTTVRNVATQRDILREVISSPASLVTTLGKDSFRKLIGHFKRDEHFPRHSNADKPPEFLGHSTLGRQYVCSLTHAQRGDHVALLTLHRRGVSFDVDVTYYPLHADWLRPEPVKFGFAPPM